MATEKRRAFIRKSAMATAGITLGAPAFIRDYAKIQPSDILNVGVIGINDRGGFYGGSGHTASFTKIRETRVTAVCDCVEYLLPKAVKDVENLGGAKPATYIDYRRMLENKDLDIVSIATPDYWHALMTINACQTGRDVYVEKPLAYNIDEGRKMVQAARKYNRIVQIGTQRRASRINQKAIQMLRDGVIGDVYMGRATVFRSRPSIGRKPDGPAPDGVNWDLFRGPAPMIPFNENHFLYNWHWYWDTSTSEFGNNGTHFIDLLRLGMNISEHPVKAAACGGFYAYQDESDQDVPNFQVATFEFANNSVIELEVRSLPTPNEPWGFIWFGTKGYAYISGNSFLVFLGDGKPASVGGQTGTAAFSTGLQQDRSTVPSIIVDQSDLDPDPRREEIAKAGIDFHFQNFVDCVKSRNRADLLADVEEGHISTTMMHIGNTAYLTGRKLIFDGRAERYVNDDVANSYLSRPGGGRKPYNVPDRV
ncbi:MAG TPA: Gfo/Idh/MocA family oxidoreductase [Bacteroidales bacterium]|jgi:predicted dehydrogenase|nr:Gfo/Idh/MocA family oxidoreductase [Bacteroidales bacterium]HOS72540.1 Gfo/Idh/MocA family oxidoreductase [Bacteroidales bacterium]HQH25459.1 Gfo/Idh/MocA family oxidoreductase [Bacteroidales bacterium]HQJ83126.1 Gfo/Idh/MocA family oxidoreductase [Bacteroidales bacterium]